MGLGKPEATPYTQDMYKAGEQRNENESIADPDRDYYHINMLVPWSPYGPLRVGEEVDVGGSSNPYFRYFETFGKIYSVTEKDGSVVQLPGVRFIDLVAEGIIDSPDIVHIARELTHHFVAYLREVIWEDVRRREFPHLPSRQRCVWLIPSQDGVKFWLRRMSVYERGLDFRVVRVQGQGRLHKASESYLLGDSEPMIETIEKARQYWQGVVGEAETEEITFEGRMHVLEVMLPSFYT